MIQSRFSPATIKLVIWLLCGALSALVAAHHEPWRDEAQAWLIARDTASLPALLQLGGYEASPMLWHLVLRPLAQAGLPYWSMQVLNLVFVLSTAAIVLYCAPFSLAQKAAIIFGYYFFYEYGIIARSYGLSNLLLTALAARYRRRIQHPLLFAALLFGLANSSSMGLILALTIGGFFLAELRGQSGRAMFLGTSLIIVLALALAVYQIIPPQDVSAGRKLAGLSANWLPASWAALAIGNAFAILPEGNIHFWNTSLWLRIPSPFWQLCSIILLISSIFCFRRHPRYLRLYLFINFALSAAIVALFLQFNSRHTGFLFLAFVFVFWITQDCTHPARVRTDRFAVSFFSLVLLFQLYASAVALYCELRQPFSPGQIAARFLSDHGYIRADTIIASFGSHIAASILPFLPESCRFYQTESGEFGSYVVWNTAFYTGGALRHLALRRLARLSSTTKPETIAP